MSQFFLGIGGQRCGTTWLADYLFAHPQVCSPVIKELHVFDHRYVPELTIDTPRSLRKSIAETERSIRSTGRRRLAPTGAAGENDHVPPEELLRAQRELLRVVEADELAELGRRYQAFFDGRREPHHRCFGEVTPAYALLPAEGFQAILSLYPEARILFVLRDPVDRFWSAVRHRESGRRRLRPPEEYLDDDRLVRRSAYELTFDVLGPLLHPDQLLVVFFEELFGPDDSTLRRVTDFLDVDFMPGDRLNRVNAASSATIPREVELRALRLFAPTYRRVDARLGYVPERWRARMALL